MKFFLDTANLNDIREAASLGLADGVTTNPSLIAKEGDVDFKKHIAAICEIVQGPVSAEVTSQDKGGMVREGLEYSKIAPNVVIKCPLTREGLKATRQLTDEGIKVNVTLCFSPAQAIVAAKAGAAFISPFLGRLDDIGENGLLLLQNIIEIYQNYPWQTEVLAASLRHPVHVIEAARMGADIATMPFKVIDQLFNHPLTDKGQAQFLADWAKSGRK
ncbi:MAG TPA: fructose-6-phosphate aldolase [Pyrinomonadaceae bacterium]|nr:fructose-6-phosphate aldolase [Pyrinomonadaceae bacterium]